jgi:hypothetical protein
MPAVDNDPAATLPVERKSVPVPRPVIFLFWAVIFGLAYTQAPLYYSNQNQYFLHGLAEGGLGLLKDDWLANTKDPTPIFSFLIATTYRYLHESLFYVYYIVMLGVYFWALTGLFAVVVPEKPPALIYYGFVAAFVFIHSGLARLISARLTGTDYPWYFQAGVAGQYVLGPTLQPSVFGVLLIVSIYLFVTDRPWWAVVTACLAGILHTTYLLSAGLLVLAYVCYLFGSDRRRAAFLMAGLAAALVAPSLAYTWFTFGPTTEGDFAYAQEVLAHYRIPHHCEVGRWLDEIAVAQIAWVAVAMWLVRGSKLFLVMFVSFAVSVTLSIAQVSIGSNFLALLFPWRASVYLVPIATAIIFARVAARLVPILERRRTSTRLAMATLVIVALAGLPAAGLSINLTGAAYQMGTEEDKMMAFVAKYKNKGYVYLIPIELPKPPKQPGQISRDFKPLVGRGAEASLIPIEMQPFRLKTGAPVFVDYKAIPYKDTELLEWHQRLQLSRQVHRSKGKDFQKALAAVQARSPVTHIVAPASQLLDGAGLEIVHEDAHYRVYRIKR